MVLHAFDFFHGIIELMKNACIMLPLSQAHIRPFWFREITNLANNREVTCGQPS
jgi:hypothetical protein